MIQKRRTPTRALHLMDTLEHSSGRLQVTDDVVAAASVLHRPRIPNTGTLIITNSATEATVLADSAR